MAGSSRVSGGVKRQVFKTEPLAHIKAETEDQ